MVLVSYENGVSVTEFVCKEIAVDRRYEYLQEWKSGTAFTSQEVETILAVYSQGLKWNKTGTEQKWLRSDSLVTATMIHGMPKGDDSHASAEERRAYNDTPTMFFASSAYLRKIDAQQGTEKAANKDERKQREAKGVVDALGKP